MRGGMRRGKRMCDPGYCEGGDEERGSVVYV